MRYAPRLHIVLHEPEIPPNAGNVGRTCVAIAAKMWLVRPMGLKLDDYYLRRAGLVEMPFRPRGQTERRDAAQLTRERICRGG